MKQRLKRLAIILSVLFNLAVLGGFVYAAYFARPASGGNASVPSVYRHLALTAEQKQALKQMLAGPLQQMSEARRQSRVKWAETVTLLSQPQPDWRAIDASHAEKLELQRQYEQALFHGWAESTSVMTPEQRQQFFAAIQQEIKSGALFNKPLPESNR